MLIRIALSSSRLKSGDFVEIVKHFLLGECEKYSKDPNSSTSLVVARSCIKFLRFRLDKEMLYKVKRLISRISELNIFKKEVVQIKQDIELLEVSRSETEELQNCYLNLVDSKIDEFEVISKFLSNDDVNVRLELKFSLLLKFIQRYEIDEDEEERRKRSLIENYIEHKKFYNRRISTEEMKKMEGMLKRKEDFLFVLMHSLDILENEDDLDLIRKRLEFRVSKFTSSNDTKDKSFAMMKPLFRRLRNDRIGIEVDSLSRELESLKSRLEALEARQSQHIERRRRNSDTFYIEEEDDDDGSSDDEFVELSSSRTWNRTVSDGEDEVMPPKSEEEEEEEEEGEEEESFEVFASGEEQQEREEEEEEFSMVGRLTNYLKCITPPFKCGVTKRGIEELIRDISRETGIPFRNFKMKTQWGGVEVSFNTPLDVLKFIRASNLTKMKNNSFLIMYPIEKQRVSYNQDRKIFCKYRVSVQGIDLGIPEYKLMVRPEIYYYLKVHLQRIFGGCGIILSIFILIPKLISIQFLSTRGVENAIKMNGIGNLRVESQKGSIISDLDRNMEKARVIPVGWIYTVNLSRLSSPDHRVLFRVIKIRFGSENKEKGTGMGKYRPPPLERKEFIRALTKIFEEFGAIPFVPGLLGNVSSLVFKYQSHMTGEKALRAMDENYVDLSKYYKNGPEKLQLRVDIALGVRPFSNRVRVKMLEITNVKGRKKPLEKRKYLRRMDIEEISEFISKRIGNDHFEVEVMVEGRPKSWELVSEKSFSFESQATYAVYTFRNAEDALRVIDLDLVDISTGNKWSKNSSEDYFAMITSRGRGRWKKKKKKKKSGSKYLLDVFGIPILHYLSNEERREYSVILKSSQGEVEYARMKHFCSGWDVVYDLQMNDVVDEEISLSSTSYRVHFGEKRSADRLRRKSPFFIYNNVKLVAK